MRKLNRANSAGFFLFTVTTAVTSGVSGCSSDDGGGSVASFSTEYSNLLCSGLSECCGALDKPVDAAQCKQLFQFQQAGLQKGIDDGKMTFDGDRADACLAAVRASDFDFCGQNDGPPACDQVVKGQVAAGEACDDDSECARPAGGDASCEIGGDSDAGKCVQEKRGTAGEACYGTCEAEGSSTTCSGFGEEPTNFIKVQCFRNDGLRCDTETKKCLALAAAGGECNSDEACESGLRCDFTDSKCVVLTATGGDCQANDECLAGFCDPSNKCAEPLALGATCDPMAERDPCGDAGRCSDEGKCEESGLFGGGSALVCGFFGG